MTRYEPEFEFDQDLEELEPAEVHDVWSDVTNLDATELKAIEDTPEHEAYLEQASDQRQVDDGPIPGGPLSDAIHLAETPRDKWKPDEKAEAIESIYYGARGTAAYKKSEGEDLTPGDDEKTSKADVALGRWGFDMRLEDEFP